MAALGYTQLDRSRKTIRLLTVAPGDQQIRCELTHADLDERPSFIALSYTWDQGGGQDEIECCGTTIQVGKNLRNFLRRFRVWDEGRGSRIWIDALCINQNDVHERNHQVGQMHALFSTARSTIAWLGEMSSNSNLVYSAMFATRYSLISADDETRQALIDLLDRPYWSRVWIIQEFLLPFHLNVWWGGCRVTANDLCRVVWTMAGLSLRSNPRDPAMWGTPGRTLLRYRVNYQRMRGSHGDASSEAFRESMRLQSLLQSFATSQYTLVHDRLYALLGIASDVTDSSAPILPDYTKQPVELVLDVLKNQYRDADPLDKMMRAQASFRHCLDRSFIRALDREESKERKDQRDFRNRHMTENDRSRQIRNFTAKLCLTMGVSRLELVVYIFQKLPRIEREIYDTLSAHETMELVWRPSMVWKLLPFPSHGESQYSPMMREFFDLITQSTECLDALQRYLTSRWSLASYRSSCASAADGLIQSLLEFRKMNCKNKAHSLWRYFGIPNISINDGNNKLLNYMAKGMVKLRVVDPKQNTAAEKASSKRLAVFSTDFMIGITHTPIQQSTKNALCAIPCPDERHFGPVLLVECEYARCSERPASSARHSWRIVTTGFACNRHTDMKTESMNGFEGEKKL